MSEFTATARRNQCQKSFIDEFFRLLLAVIALVGICFALALTSATKAEAASPQIVFKALLIIKPYTAIPAQTGFPGANATMTQAQVNGMTRSFMVDFPYWIQTMTNNRVAIAPKVIVSSTPLTTMAHPYWVGIGPQDVQAELNTNVGASGGAWDSVFVYTNIVNNGQILTPYIGLSESIPGLAHWVGFSSLYTTNVDNFTVNGEYGTETFIHEWLHHHEMYYAEIKGVPMPYCPPPGSTVSDFPSHCAGILPQYPHDSLLGWKKYHKDFLNGKVKDANGNIRGLGEAAWVKGTPAGSFNTSPPRAIPTVTDGVPAAFWKQAKEAESNPGSGVVFNCSICSGGAAVGFLGNSQAALNVTNLIANRGGNYQVNVRYINGDIGPRSGWLFLDGVYVGTVSYPSSGSWSAVATKTINLQVTAGTHWLQFASPTWLPDIDKIDFIE